MVLLEAAHRPFLWNGGRALLYRAAAVTSEGTFNGFANRLLFSRGSPLPHLRRFCTQSDSGSAHRADLPAADQRRFGTYSA